MYGQIAAANSLSDVYAMGGRPVTALAIAAFPAGRSRHRRHRADLSRRLRQAARSRRGAPRRPHRAGHRDQVRLRGDRRGRSRTDSDQRRREPGDRLILTKPIGTGIVGTAIKFGRAPEELIDHAVEQMRTLNKAAAEAIVGVDGVHACTDITGFGLAGHASEMAAAAKCRSTSTRAPCRSFLACSRSRRRIAPGAWQRTRSTSRRKSRFAPAGPAISPGSLFQSSDVWRTLDFGSSGGRRLVIENLSKAGIQAIFVGVVKPLRAAHSADIWVIARTKYRPHQTLRTCGTSGTPWNLRGP